MVLLWFFFLSSRVFAYATDYVTYYTSWYRILFNTDFNPGMLTWSLLLSLLVNTDTKQFSNFLKSHITSELVWRDTGLRSCLVSKPMFTSLDGVASTSQMLATRILTFWWGENACINQDQSAYIADMSSF